MDVTATVGEQGEVCAPFHARAPVLGRALGRVHVLGLDHGLGPHVIAGDAILTSLQGMVGTVEGVGAGLVLVEEVEGEGDVVDTVEPLGLVLRLVGVGPHVDDHQATNVAGTEGAGRGRPRTLCALVGRGRDLTLVPALHVLDRGRAPCLTLPTRGTVGAGAGVVPVLDLRVVEGGATAKTIFEIAGAGRGHQGISHPYLSVRLLHSLLARYTLQDSPPSSGPALPIRYSSRSRCLRDLETYKITNAPSTYTSCMFSFYVVVHATRYWGLRRSE